MNHLGQIGGLPGWRWLFIAEGIPTVALGLFALIWLADSPAHARNLSEPERQWLVAQLQHDKAVAEAAAPQQAKSSFLMSALADRRVWLLSLAYFGEIAGLYGAVFWLPQVIGQLSPEIGSDRAILLTMVPFAVGTVTLLLNAARSDRKQERSWHITGGFLVGALGLGSTGLISDPWLGFVALTIGIAGLCAATGLFWSIPTGMFRGLAHAAAAFTLINVVGNVSGLVIPAVIGMLRVATGDFSSALLLLAGLLLMSAALMRIVGEPADGLAVA